MFHDDGPHNIPMHFLKSLVSKFDTLKNISILDMYLIFLLQKVEFKFSFTAMKSFAGCVLSKYDSSKHDLT